MKRAARGGGRVGWREGPADIGRAGWLKRGSCLSGRRHRPRRAAGAARGGPRGFRPTARPRPPSCGRCTGGGSEAAPAKGPMQTTQARGGVGQLFTSHKLPRIAGVSGCSRQASRGERVFTASLLPAQPRFRQASGCPPARALVGGGGGERRAASARARARQTRGGSHCSPYAPPGNALPMGRSAPATSPDKFGTAKEGGALGRARGPGLCPLGPPPRGAPLKAVPAQQQLCQRRSTVRRP